MLGQLDIRGVDVLDVLIILLLLGAVGAVLSRGRRTAWAARAAAGLGLLALARFGGMVALQWFLWDAGAPVTAKIRTYGWIQGGLWLISTAGLVLLVAAVLTGRRAAEVTAPPAPHPSTQTE